jgi:AcrR family transcriptional regulator
MTSIDKRPATSTKRARRTQEERSHTMRKRLLDATVECLVESGYAGTSTNAVCRKAGVSRGALLHHFPTKESLVTTAIDHVMAVRAIDFQAAMEPLKGTDDERVLTREILERLWAHLLEPIFFAYLELLIAARTDPALKAAMLPVVERYRWKVEETYRVLNGLPPAKTDTLAVGPRFTFLLLMGMAMERLEADVDMELRVMKALGKISPVGLAVMRAESESAPTSKT